MSVTGQIKEGVPGGRFCTVGFHVSLVHVRPRDAMTADADPKATGGLGDIARLAAWLASHHRIAVITGAGVSTESGIPDYRNREGNWKRSPPMQHWDFVENAALRRRYWARSMIGWPMFVSAQPSAAHRALAQLEGMGRMAMLITQNVDGLHQRAGSRRVIDLHGRLDVVVCLTCGNRSPRDAFQSRLLAANPGWETKSARIAPDGDADVEGRDFDAFEVLGCELCGGTLKPDVVFYGGSVPPQRSAKAMATVTGADSVLVAGSSLMVWSSFRLVRAASDASISIAAVNRGQTRADSLLDMKCDGECGALLSAALDKLGA